MFSLIKWLIIIVLVAGFSPSFLNASRLEGGKVFIIIQKDLHPHLDNKAFQGWIEQLKSESWKTIVLIPEPYEIDSANKLKEYLIKQSVYRHAPLYQDKTNGVILIGTFPKTYVDLGFEVNFTSSDIWYMDMSDKLNLRADKFEPPHEIMVKPNEEIKLHGFWLSRIELNEEESIPESGASISQYLMKNTDCRSSGFASDGCLLKAQLSNHKFWESKALIGMAGHDELDWEISLSDKTAGEAFLDLFASAQKDWKKWQDYFFREGWEHCSSFVGDMYYTHNRIHSRAASSASPGGIPPLDKVILYGFQLPVLFTTALGSAVCGWKLPSLRKYLGAAWALVVAASMVPKYKCPPYYFLPKRHYLPVLLGDGTLRKF